MTLLTWMLYTAAVGALVASAAWCLDRALGRLRLSTRWIWAAAMALSLALPATALFPADTLPPGEGTPAAIPHPAASATATPTPAPPEAYGTAIVAADRLVGSFNRTLQRAGTHLPASDPLGQWILLAWAATSLALTALLAGAALRLRNRRRGWPPTVLNAHPVRISPDLGPAVVGVLRPEIVIPDRLRQLHARELDLILAHESEHLRARDSLLLGAALVPLLLLPWHPALWWQLHRLRAAVELDCDRRVLGRGVAPAAYAAILVRIGAGRSIDILPSPALAGSTSFLEKRLKAMKERSLASSLPLALIGAVAASGLLLLACEAEVPTPVRDAAPTEVEVDVEAVDAREAPFTPFAVRPEVRNVDEVSRAMQRVYPLETREVSGTVRVHVFIDEEGIPQNIVIAQSSGHEVVDAAALQVAPVLRFSPALNRDQRVPVWVEVPITFKPRDDRTSNGA